MTDASPPSDFLKVGLDHALLTAESATRISQLMTERGSPPSDVALEEGLLDAIEVDIIETLRNAHDVAPGYEILGVLGRGGMGVVFRARQKNLQREVAIKTLLIGQLTQRDALRRFEREGQTIAKLQHPNIVAAFDSGKHKGRIYLVMELIAGHDLGQYIHRLGALPERAAWLIARQIAGGLAHAQQTGIVHRDIKPANVLVVKGSEELSPGGEAPLVKISDFGLTLLAGEAEPQTRLTQTGRVVGTPNFMAPEQLTSASVDCRADIYALGGTVYNMVTGQPPFGGCNVTQLMARKLSDAPPPDPREIEPRLSRATADLVADMMANDPEYRIADYKTLIQRIDETLARIYDQPTGPISLVAQSTALTVETPRPPSSAKQPIQPLAQRVYDDPPDRPSTFTWVISIICLVTIALFAASGVLALRRASRPPQPVLVPGQANQPLFNGESVAGWGGEPGSSFLPEIDLDGGRALEVSGAVTRAWDFEQPTDNYRLSLGVALQEAEMVEVQFGPIGNRGFDDCFALRIEGDNVSLVAYRSGDVKTISELPAGAVRINRDEFHYYSVRIERQLGHWWAIFEGEVVGHTPVHADAELTETRLVAEQERALFDEIMVEELIEP